MPVTPPLDPMLARLQTDFPRGEGWVYEPKWDGFRAIAFIDSGDVHIASRDHKPLQRYFPELPEALGEAFPDRCVIDGEVLVTNEQGLDFDALLQRIHPARSRIEKLASETPAAFVAFDVLALDDRDLMAAPLGERRAALEGLLGPAEEPVLPSRATEILITPQTADADRAIAWMTDYEATGLDGLVAKQLDSIYLPGERRMVKVKLQRTADCVIGGYRLSKSGDGVGSLLLGLYDTEGVLQYVGHTSGFKAKERREVLEQLRPLEGGESFGSGRAPGGQNRWTGGRDTTWTAVRPTLVCEVSYDRLLGRRFRHATGFVRWRPDRDPKSCTFEQLGR